MRVSVDKNDPGFIKDGYRYAIYLDGIYLSNCITADEEEGWALVFTDHTPTGFNKEEVHGKIEIKLEEKL